MNAPVLDDSREISPRTGSARSALLDVLGEFVLSGDVPDPSTSVLIRTLGEVGIGHHAARQAIRRCGQSGWIAGAKAGREVHWKLTHSGRALVSDGIERVEALGVDISEWDGRWATLFCSIPQDVRSVRDALQRSLQWNGFGSPMAGVWLSAHPGRLPAIERAVARCGLEDSTISFVGEPSGVGLDNATLIARSWELEELAARYEALVARFSVLAPRTHSDALSALLSLNAELQHIPAWDPQLPSALVPDWSGRRAAAALLDLRSHWLEGATQRWLQLQS